MVRRYYVIAFVLLCVCLAVQPMSIAYATEGSEGGDFSYKVVYGPSTPTILGSTKQVQVYAPNNYEAALIVLGYQNDSRLTSDARALLSNQSTGGTFYDFAQGFSNNNDYWGNQLNFQDLGMNTALSMNNSMYGANNIWSSEYDDTMYDGAKQRVEAVLNGDITGGGSGGTIDNDYLYFSGGTMYLQYASSTYPYLLSQTGAYYNNRLQWRYNNDLQQDEYYSGNGTSSSDTILLPHPLVVKASKRLFPELPTDVSKMSVSIRLQTNGKLEVRFYDNSTYTYSNNTQYVTSEYVSKVNYGYATSSITFDLTGDTFYSFDGSTITLDKSETSTRTYKLWTENGNLTGNYTIMILPYTDGTGMNPTIPPTNWPDNPTPTTPQPPEVPEPPNDPVSPQPPEPTDPTNPVYPTIVYEPDFVWQTADLSAILSAMDAHCRHLQAALHRECSNLWANLSVKIGTEFKALRSFLHGQFGWLVDSIDEEFDDFELYLKTLFEWLADQMEFSFTGGGYDDNTVVSWLKKIYSKLGGGTNTRPVDPTVEPDNWWDWLTRLIADWIAGLTDMGLDELAGLLELLQELITKFPFSIPWDIAALLALLVSEPVTPEIRMPQMALIGSGLTQVGEYVVNLSDYNAVWEGVRFIEKVGFCIFLAWNTVHFMDLFKKGANSE